MYPCDTELVAMYVNGDLDGAEATPVEDHLNACPACRALAEELQADTLSLRKVVHSMQMPEEKPRTRPSRRWIPATAAAVLTVMVLGFTAGPTLAESAKRIFSWLDNENVTQAEFEEGIQRLNEWEATQPPTTPKKKPLVKTDDPAEMEAAVGFPILKPTYLPAGYESAGILLWPNERDPEKIYPHQNFKHQNGGQIEVIQEQLNGTSYTTAYPKDSYRELKVGKSKALLTYGIMLKGLDGKYTFDTSTRELVIDRGSQAILITVNDAALSDDEIIKFAESIPE